MSRVKKKTPSKKIKKAIEYPWVIKLTCIAFIVSLMLSIISDRVLSKSGMIVGILILLVFIFLGIIFDMLGVAVTSADAKPFNAMASKKIRGAKVALKLIKNTDKISSFCCDVIGDICGVASGSAGIVIATSIASYLQTPGMATNVIVTAIVAALTIGGKAMGKGVAVNNSTNIIFAACKVLSYHEYKKQEK